MQYACSERRARQSLALLLPPCFFAVGAPPRCCRPRCCRPASGIRSGWRNWGRRLLCYCRLPSGAIVRKAASCIAEFARPMPVLVLSNVTSGLNPRMPFHATPGSLPTTTIFLLAVATLCVKGQHAETETEHCQTYWLAGWPPRGNPWPPPLLPAQPCIPLGIELQSASQVQVRACVLGGPASVSPHHLRCLGFAGHPP